MHSMPRPYDGSIDTRAVLRRPADVTRTGREVAHRAAVDARCLRHRTRDRVRRICPPTRVDAAKAAGTYANAAHPGPCRSHGTRNSANEAGTYVWHDNADGIARRAAFRTRTPQRQQGAGIRGW